VRERGTVRKPLAKVNRARLDSVLAPLRRGRRPDAAWEGVMLKDNPMVKKLVQTGEERVGKLASTLLSNESFVGAVQSLVSKSLAAKGSLDKSLRSALAAMNLPSSADVEALRAKVEDLDQLLTSVEKKVDALLAARKTP
jgi:hypothetical protein